MSNAQRRPGPKPRRQSQSSWNRATPVNAQRRPGPKPRRQLRRGDGPVQRVVRSTKAGAETPATAVGPLEINHVALRSTKAGAETPATVRFGNCRWLRSSRALNEGRGRNPGDSFGLGTLRTALRALAQRRPGPKPRRQFLVRQCEGDRSLPRSTKAGAETPATAPASELASAVVSPPLNEGRGRNPGDSRRTIARSPTGHPALNEGRGRNPGDSCATRARWRVANQTAQRRPGPKPRRQARCPA